jgi:Ca-activated chloride channel homolog
MIFRWPFALLLLIAVPLLVAAYAVALRRGREHARRFEHLRLLSDVPGAGKRLIPHLPPLMLLFGITALLVAAARPVVLTTTPAQEGTVVLLIDVSLSMAASDVVPTRLEAAQAASRTFVESQPRDVRIGVVAFGGYADVVQPPTLNRLEVLAAIERLELQRFTAMGTGLLAALLTIVPNASIPHEYDLFGIGRAPEGAYDVHPVSGERVRQGTHKPLRPGSYLSAAIVLVSDGYNTMGIPPVMAAQVLARHGIRVYTVGVGTVYGGAALVDGWPPIHAEYNDETLKQIAAITRGEHFLARRAERLPGIYEKLGRRVVLEPREYEVTALVTALGALLFLAAVALALMGSIRRD